MSPIIVGGSGLKGARALSPRPVTTAGGGGGGGGSTPLTPIRAPDTGLATAPSDSLSSNLDLQSKFEQAMHQVITLILLNCSILILPLPYFIPQPNPCIVLYKNP